MQNNNFVELQSDVVYFGNNIICLNEESQVVIIANSISINNCIWQNNPNIYIWIDSPTTISHSTIPGLDCATLPPNITCGPGIITSGDPMFVNPDSNDYRLQPCSPLRDAGTNAAVPPYLLTDLDGRPRILGGTVDIGAYEIPDFTSTVTPTVRGACTDATNGSVAFETEGGCPPFTYLWQPGNGGGTSATGPAPGTCVFTVTDAGGRTFLDTVAVPELPAPDSLQFSAVVQNATGPVLPDGSVSFTAVLGGTGPYGYLWSDGSTGPVPGNVPPGTYTVTITGTSCFAAQRQ